MDPLVRPGSLVLVDPSQRAIEAGPFRNEFERPIYFVDIRSGYRCSWCTRDADHLVLHPYGLSARAPQFYRGLMRSKLWGAWWGWLCGCRNGGSLDRKQIEKEMEIGEEEIA